MCLVMHSLCWKPIVQATGTLLLQGSSDEAASFCFNVLDAGRRGLVGRDNFVAATHSCAGLALHDQPIALQDTQWAEATAAGALLFLDTSAKQTTTTYTTCIAERHL